MSLAALLAIPALALAQPVSSVPADAEAVTVFVCDRTDGCPTAGRAVAGWTAALGMPLVDFDTVAFTGPAGQDARERYLARIEELRARPSLEAAEAAREALRSYPFTVPPEDLLLIHIQLAAGLMAGKRPAEAQEAFTVAATISNGRVHDLPALPEAILQRYFEALQAVSQPGAKRATLRISASSAGALVYVDGRSAGPAPATMEVLPGWHRVTVERTGRRTAWVGEVTAGPGWVLDVPADVEVDDGTAALEAAVKGAIRGEPPSSGITAALTRWARDNELRWVRFVELENAPVGSTPERRPDDLVLDPDGTRWALYDAWLDVAGGRFTQHSPGNGVLRSGARLSRFRLGAGMGYAHLAPRHHVTFDVDALIGLRGPWWVDVRVGAARSNDDYFLYEGWRDPHVYPVSAGLRWGRSTGGPFAGVSGIAFVPYALGGVARVGWELAPSTWWRIDVEATGGMTDKGWVAGGDVRAARRY